MHKIPAQSLWCIGTILALFICANTVSALVDTTKAYPAGTVVPTTDYTGKLTLSKSDDFTACTSGNAFPSTLMALPNSDTTSTSYACSSSGGTATLSVAEQPSAGAAVTFEQKSTSTISVGTYGIRIIARMQATKSSTAPQATTKPTTFVGFKDSGGTTIKTYYNYFAQEDVVSSAQTFTESYGYYDGAAFQLGQSSSFVPADNAGGTTSSVLFLISILDILPANVTWSSTDFANSNYQTNGLYKTTVSSKALAPYTSGYLTIGGSAGKVSSGTTYATNTLVVDWIAVYNYNAPTASSTSSTSSAGSFKTSFSLLSFIIGSLMFTFYLKN